MKKVVLAGVLVVVGLFMTSAGYCATEQLPTSTDHPPVPVKPLVLIWGD